MTRYFVNSRLAGLRAIDLEANASFVVWKTMPESPRFRVERTRYDFSCGFDHEAIITTLTRVVNSSQFEDLISSVLLRRARFTEVEQSEFSRLSELLKEKSLGLMRLEKSETHASGLLDRHASSLT